MKYYLYYVDISKLSKQMVDNIISIYDDMESDKYDEQIIHSNYILYAWTTKKKMGDRFSLYRNESIFKRKKIHSDKLDDDFEKLFFNFEITENNYATRSRSMNNLASYDNICLVGPNFEYTLFDEALEHFMDSDIWDFYTKTDIELLQKLPEITTKKIRNAFDIVGWSVILDTYQFVAENGYYDTSIFYDEFKIYFKLFSELYV